MEHGGKEQMNVEHGFVCQLWSFLFVDYAVCELCGTLVEAGITSHWPLPLIEEIVYPKVFISILRNIAVFLGRRVLWKPFLRERMH